MQPTIQPTIQQLADGCLQFLREHKSEYALQVWLEFEDIIVAHPLWTPRFHAWMCQAHLNLHQPKEALRHCYTGIRLAKAIEDSAGVSSLEDLRNQAVGMLGALTKQAEDREHLLAQADAAIQAKDWETAETLVMQSLNEALSEQDGKLEILSLLTLARIPSRQTEYLQRAHDRSQELNDFNLITLVKKSYDALGVDIPSHIF